MSKFVFIGLGNPGEQYAQTRHNAGWMALDTLVHLWQDPAIPAHWRAEKKIYGEVLKITHGAHEIMCIKPDTFMNESGKAALAAAKWFLDTDPSAKPDQTFKNIVVLHDDLDIVAGEYKLKFATGPRVHNGYNSVIESLQSDQFWSARIGIDAREGDRTLPGKAYVLQKAPPQEHERLVQAIHTLAEELPYIVLQ